MALKATSGLLKSPLLYKATDVYRNYVTEVIEFKNTNGIYKKGTNDRSIFGAEPSYSPVLAVGFKLNCF
jgi:hypothetical protein